MYIVQFSDFHIKDDDFDFDKKKCILNKMLTKISELINEKNEKIVCIINGDIIDHSSKDLKEEEIEKEFDNADKLLSVIKQHFNDQDFVIGICPGNHDIVNKKIDKFTDIAKKHMPDNFIEYPYVLEIADANTDFIFVNTVYSGDYKRGHIDFKSLNEALNRSHHDYKYLVIHHTILSMDNTDHSSIINAAKLISIIDKNNIQAVFHGHTHGIDGTMIGHNNCILLGAGATFSNNNPDVNSQFNFFYYDKGQFTRALNCRYNNDAENLNLPDFSEYNLLPLIKSQCNYFSDKKFSASYDKLIHTLSVNNNILYNVTINGLFNYQDFRSDIMNNFGSKNELGYTYNKLAEMWEMPTCPNELYFNHGKFFTVNNKHGIEYVIEQLKKNPTSSRAMLSTINFHDIIKNADDEFLPSFTNIQFSFHQNGTTLFVSANYRALEAFHFLKINICEILYLVEKIHQTAILGFEKIQLSIHAFRVQLLENFSCFLKSQIDIIAPSDITYIVIMQEIQKLRNLLVEKKDCRETVIVSTGMENLYSALKTAIKNDISLYCSIIDNVKEIIDLYQELIGERKKTSINSENIQRIEKQLSYNFDLIIEYLEQEGGITDDAK